jgi:hypothetical protein
MRASAVSHANRSSEPPPQNKRNALSDDEHGVNGQAIAPAAQRLGDIVVQREAKLFRTVAVDPVTRLVDVYSSRR